MLLSFVSQHQMSPKTPRRIRIRLRSCSGRRILYASFTLTLSITYRGKKWQYKAYKKVCEDYSAEDAEAQWWKDIDDAAIVKKDSKKGDPLVPVELPLLMQKITGFGTKRKLSDIEDLDDQEHISELCKRLRLATAVQPESAGLSVGSSMEFNVFEPGAASVCEAKEDKTPVRKNGFCIAHGSFTHWRQRQCFR